MNHYPHHIGDFNNGTRHLTRIERSIYRDLIELYYDTESPLNGDIDALARRIIARSDEERAALDAVLGEFFKLQEGAYFHSRCDEELAKYKALADRGKEGAAKRWSKGENSPPINKHMLKNGVAIVKHDVSNSNQNQEPEPRTIIPPTPKGVKEEKVDEGFESFWESYPRKTGKGAARNAWAKAKLPEIDLILSALHKAKKSPDWLKERGAYIPHPATWLNQCRWEDSGMDYEALTQKRVLSLSSTPQEAFQVDEQDALNWIAENYEVKAGVPYRDWPQNVQAEYRNQLKQLQAA